MSDTPRTDALWLELNADIAAFSKRDKIWDFARDLERENARLLADAERLDLMQSTESYPFKDYKCWKFIVGKQIVEGATVRECLDAALAALKGSP